MWAAVELASADTVERLQAARGSAAAIEALAARRRKGDDAARPLHPTPAALKALTQATLLLGHAAPVVAEPAAEALERLSLRELADEVLRVHEGLR
jgi:hypothetical protein